MLIFGGEGNCTYCTSVSKGLFMEDASLYDERIKWLLGCDDY